MLSVQLIAAAVGDVVGVVLLQLLRASAGGVAFTAMLTAADAAVPVFGVAVSVPL